MASPPAIVKRFTEPGDFAGPCFTDMLHDPGYAGAVVNPVSFAILDIDVMHVATLVLAFQFIQLGVEQLGQADSIEHGVFLAHICAKGQVAQVFGGIAQIDTRRHGVGACETIGHERRKNICTVSTF